MALDLRVGEVPAGDGMLRYHVLEERLEGHVVWVQEITQHLDLSMTDPSLGTFMERLSRYGLTNIVMQPRGIALSDPSSRLPTLEEQVEDVLAVMDAEGVERATLIGSQLAGPAAALTAARRPDRVQGLVLLGCPPVGARVDDRAGGWTPETARVCVARYEKAIARWGEGYSLDIWDPALCTPLSRRFVGMMERCAAAPALGQEWFRRALTFDGREIYAQVRVPTLVLSVPGSTNTRATAEALTALIPGAEHRVLPASQLGDSIGSAWIPVSDAVATVALGSAGAAAAVDRVLTTVLFTDIVDSTGHVARLGDAAWEDLLDAHDRLVGREAVAAGGRVVETTGDGTLCELPGPAAAVRCARAIGTVLEPLDLRIRAGVHTGECLRRGPALTGLAIHVGARVAALAGPGEVLLTGAAREIADGAELRFAAMGARELKGVPGRWEVYAAELGGHRAGATVRPRPRAIDRVALGAARSAPRAVRTLNRAVDAYQRRRHGRRDAATVAAHGD